MALWSIFPFSFYTLNQLFKFVNTLTLQRDKDWLPNLHILVLKKKKKVAKPCVY